MSQPVNMKLLKGVLYIYCIIVKGVKGVRYLKTPNMKTKGTSWTNISAQAVAGPPPHPMSTYNELRQLSPPSLQWRLLPKTTQKVEKIIIFKFKMFNIFIWIVFEAFQGIFAFKSYCFLLEITRKCRLLK